MTEPITKTIMNLTRFCDEYDTQKAAQSINDLRKSISQKEAVVRELEQQRDDALAAAEAARATDDLTSAFIFDQYAGLLLERIEDSRPHSLNRRLNDLLQTESDVRAFRELLVSMKG